MVWALKKAPQSAPDFTLKGFRVHMRPPQLRDYREWVKVRSANQEFLTPFEPTWPKDCLTEEFYKRLLARQAKNWRAGRSCSFLICRNEGDLIGGMNINGIARGSAQYASLGYWLAEDAQGVGYMSEALRLTAQYCFEALDLHRINASCLLYNERSKNLLLRGGFVQEGMAKEYLKINGVWQDHLLFGLCATDWRAQQSA